MPCPETSMRCPRICRFPSTTVPASTCPARCCLRSSLRQRPAAASTSRWFREWSSSSATREPDAPIRRCPLGGNQIPGARGCTPQSCSFRDHQDELHALGARVFGLRTQTTDYQQEAVERLHLPFELLSDASREFARALKLPVFEADEVVLIKRVTLIVEDGRIVKVFFPVFPPDRNVVTEVSFGGRFGELPSARSPPCCYRLRGTRTKRSGLDSRTVGAGAAASRPRGSRSDESSLG